MQCHVCAVGAAFWGEREESSLGSRRGLRVAGKVPHEEGGFGELLRTEVGHTGLCSISWCVWFCSSLLSLCRSIWRRAAGALGGCKEAAHGYFLLKKKKRKKYDEML